MSRLRDLILLVTAVLATRVPGAEGLFTVRWDVTNERVARTLSEPLLPDQASNAVARLQWFEDSGGTPGARIADPQVLTAIARSLQTLPSLGSAAGAVGAEVVTVLSETEFPRARGRELGCTTDLCVYASARAVDEILVAATGSWFSVRDPHIQTERVTEFQVLDSLIWWKQNQACITTEFNFSLVRRRFDVVRPTDDGDIWPPPANGYPASSGRRVIGVDTNGIMQMLVGLPWPPCIPAKPKASP